MSVIQQSQLEACEKRLRELPSFGLFNGCTDANVQELWRISYDAGEGLAPAHLLRMRDLTFAVMGRLPSEALLVTMHEYDLLEQLLLGNGSIRLNEWHETVPAESLVRRLWCTVRISEETDTVTLRMEPQIRLALMHLMASEDYQALRDRVTRVNAAVMYALNVYGILYADDVFVSLGDQLLGLDTGLVERMLKIAFDYCVDRAGKMVLLHPALAEPERAMRGLQHVDLRPFAEIDPLGEAPEMFLSDTEHQAIHRLWGLIDAAMRQGYAAQYCVEDLRFLAKQSVTFDALSEVLASQLAVRPTADMLDALRQLQMYAPGFVCMQSRKVL